MFCVWNEKRWSSVNGSQAPDYGLQKTEIKLKCSSGKDRYKILGTEKQIKIFMLMPTEQRFHQSCLYGKALNYSYVKESISAVQI